MRNFSTRISISNTFVLDVTCDMTDSDFVAIQHALMIAMDANPSFMTPSEEAVLADFIGWVQKGKENDLNGYLPLNPLFVYVNLSTGRNIGVVMMDKNGRLSVSHSDENQVPFPW